LLGLHPDWGGSWFLPSLVGAAKACELVFTGAMISAQEAGRIGLVNQVVPHGKLLETVTELAGRIAANPAVALAAAKQSIYRSLTSDLETAFARENEVQTQCFNSEDFLEGVTAFLEKRKPQFKGR
jgi:2-(1,2-epoxy-1,2-dihydrophenyl)acetyl-CoA isomerase